MIFSRRFCDLIDTLLRKNLPFAAYFLPGENQPRLCLQQDPALNRVESYKLLNRPVGFVFAPFVVTQAAPLVVIQPDIELIGFEQIKSFNFFSLPNNRQDHHLVAQEQESAKHDYINSLHWIIDKIHCKHIEKLIFSRLLYQNRRKNQSLGLLLEEMQQQNPSAFNYLVNLPSVGTWMGATPETLLSADEQSFSTMALAGTQPRTADGVYRWAEKEKQEQAIVCQYIRQLLHKYQVDQAYESPRHSIESGKVAHLCTQFTFKREQLDSHLGEFIKDLHPTPAVCGLPKEKAMQTILQTEPHNREYYTGFSCPCYQQGKLDLFVNLRCMKIMPDKFLLYSGGGITSGSTPESEWEETSYKSKTLLSAISNVNA